MKKQFYSLGLIVAAAFTLTNCTKEIDQPDQAPESAGIPFEITASTVDTKTAAGDDLTTVWVNNDALSVFHAEAGSTDYGTNDQFTITTETLAQNKFTGTLTEGLDDSKTYDWYAFYPYSEYYNGKSQKIGYTTFGHTCNNFSTAKALRQTGNSSMTHLAGDVFPLYGKASAIAPYEAVSVSMQHLMSVIELKVTNKATEEFTVTGIKFSTPVNVVGSFYYNTSTGVYEPSQANGAYNSKTSELSVVDAEPIAVDASATFYLAVIPVTLSEGEVSITVVTDKGEQTKTKTLVEDNSDDIVFTAGKIKKMHFDFSAEVALKTVSLPWIENFGTTESPSDLSNYVIIDGESETKLYNEASAGGTAPELLIGKTTGSLSVNVDVKEVSGYLTLFFKSNNDYISVTSSTEDVIVEKIVQGKFHINVPEDVELLQLSLNNNEGKNVRIDDINLVARQIKIQPISFETPTYNFTINSDELNSFTGQTVLGAETTVTYTSSNTNVADVNAETGVVTMKDVVGTAIITATAVETTDYFGATASYTIVVSPSVKTVDEAIASETTVAVADGEGVATTSSGVIITQKKVSGSTSVSSSYTTVGTMRVYKGHSLTFNGKDFTKIVITYRGSYSGSDMTASSGSLVTDTEKKTVTWEGYANEVVITNNSTSSNTQLRLEKIDVTYADADN